ncbi:MAG: hypothetical protein PVS2B2_12830 [Candidatus Acidiferrum sp.]
MFRESVQGVIGLFRKPFTVNQLGLQSLALHVHISMKKHVLHGEIQWLLQESRRALGEFWF